ncbi:hypothetical protein D621_15365 [beta proteobacterium AAP51]|nr:hypothetical protein D621_15365 [beta proteobacterium AAP51]
MTAPELTPAQAPPPGFGARIGCLLYEFLLLFGVFVGLVLLPAIAAMALTQHWPGLIGPPMMGTWVFLVFGAYFVYFWTRGGQTLAMLTWRIRVVTVDGRPLGYGRAAMRYLLGWMWVLPAPLVVHFSGDRGWGLLLVALLTGLVVYMALARLHPDRQTWHDALCKTRLIQWNPAKRP